jgi:hypothetical protein
MVAGALDTILIPSLRLEEIASDGSTLTNPAADSRRLFLGEDGLLHLIDSSGTVTDVGSGVGGGIDGLRETRATRTSGNLSPNSNGAWADLDTGLDLTIAAATSDKLLIGFNTRSGSENVTLYLDVATIVSASPVNYVASGGTVGRGIGGWIHPPNINAHNGGPVPYTVQSGDISGGNVVLRLRYSTSSATAKTLVATTSEPMVFWAINLKQP